MNMKHLLASSAIALAVAVPATASTLNFTVTDITATFKNAVNGQNVEGEGTNELSWGDPTTVTDPRRSNYRFTATPTDFSFNVPAPGSVDFLIGNFFHNNFPIPAGSGINGAELDIIYTIEMPTGGASTTRTSTAIFTHEETTNTGPGCCDDIVTIITLALAAPEYFNIGGYSVVLSELGFTSGFTDMGDGTLQWLTAEGASNSSDVRARIEVIPLPATGWLLLSLMGVGAVAQYRRRKAA